MRGAAPVLLLVLLALAAASWSGVRLEQAEREVRDGKELLLLPNGKHLKTASLGQAQLLADLIYLWAIQYYSVYEREDRFEYVEHIFADVIAELDPHYVDAYWMGALILTVEAHDVDRGLALLDMGIENNPESWMLPFLAGWESYHAERYDRAEAYFAAAEGLPDAPAYIRRTRIGMSTARGEHRRAYAMWLEVLQDPASDAATIDIAERQLRFLKIKIDTKDLQGLVDRFRVENGRLPRSLNELATAGYIQALPLDPLGRPYAYDAGSGVVAAQEDRILPGAA